MKLLTLHALLIGAAALSTACKSTPETDTEPIFLLEEGPTPPLLQKPDDTETGDVSRVTRSDESDEFSPSSWGDNWVAFSTNDRGGFDIGYVNYADDRGVGHLVATPANEKAPSVHVIEAQATKEGHPPPARCYFATNSPDVYEIWSVDTANHRGQTTEAGASAGSDLNWPDVSRDGKRLLFSGLNNIGVYQVLWRDLESRTTWSLHEGQRARWNPADERAGEYIYARRGRGAWNIFRSDITNPIEEQITVHGPGSDCFDPSFSPDGRFIAYASNLRGSTDIWVMPSEDPDQATAITTHGAIDCQPVWLDNETIAFTSNRNDSWDIYKAVVPTGAMDTGSAASR